MIKVRSDLIKITRYTVLTKCKLRAYYQVLVVVPVLYLFVMARVEQDTFTALLRDSSVRNGQISLNSVSP